MILMILLFIVGVARGADGAAWRLSPRRRGDLGMIAPALGPEFPRPRGPRMRCLYSG